MKLYASLLTASMFMAMVVGAGCSDTSNTTNDGKAVASVDIGPDKQTLTVGTMFQFEVTVKYADGTTDNVSEDTDTVWNTSDPAIATVSKTGMVTAIAVGVVDISANFKGMKANEHFGVTP